MNTLTKKVVRETTKSLKSFPLFPLSGYQFLIKRKVVGLCYHTVSNEPLYHIKHLYAYKTLEIFENHLRFLKQNYNLISYEQLVKYHSLKTKIIPNSIILTFDDGFSECYSTVRPLLLKYEIPCIFFITTDFIDNRNMFYRNKVSLCIEKIRSLDKLRIMDVICKINSTFEQCIRSPESFIQWIKSLNSSDEDIINETCNILEIDFEQYLITYKPYLTSENIRQLVTDGFTIGAHSKKHLKLNLLRNEDKIEEEIVDSCRKIMDLTGIKNVPFAFPFSGDGLDRAFLKNLLSKYKFVGLLFDLHGLRKDKDFIINRIWCESPSFSVNSKLKMRQILRRAYQYHFVGSVGGMLK